MQTLARISLLALTVRAQTFSYLEQDDGRFLCVNDQTGEFAAFRACCENIAEACASYTYDPIGNTCSVQPYHEDIGALNYPDSLDDCCISSSSGPMVNMAGNLDNLGACDEVINAPIFMKEVYEHES